MSFFNSRLIFLLVSLKVCQIILSDPEQTFQQTISARSFNLRMESNDIPQ